MKISGIKSALVFSLSILVVLSGCDETITDFGNNGAISGTLQDEAGNVVPGNITSSVLVVKALGEGDQVSTDIRVTGDGTFQHTKLFPKTYKVWVSGPVSLVTDTLMIDFSKQKSVEQDLVVVPFVSISKPVAGSTTATSIDVTFDMAANEGKTIAKREVYVSTNPYPDTSTGSGPFYHTKKATLNADQGTVSVTGLTGQTKYFIRVGAQATGASGFNFSEQLVVTTP